MLRFNFDVLVLTNTRVAFPYIALNMTWCLKSYGTVPSCRVDHKPTFRLEKKKYFKIYGCSLR